MDEPLWANATGASSNKKPHIEIVLCIYPPSFSSGWRICCRIAAKYPSCCRSPCVETKLVVVDWSGCLGRESQGRASVEFVPVPLKQAHFTPDKTNVKYPQTNCSGYLGHFQM